MIRYTEQERELMNSTTIRGYLVLKKLGRLVGDEQREPIVSIPTESFIGQGYDQKDMDRISGELSEMTEIISKFRWDDWMPRIIRESWELLDEKGYLK